MRWGILGGVSIILIFQYYRFNDFLYKKFILCFHSNIINIIENVFCNILCKMLKKEKCIYFIIY